MIGQIKSERTHSDLQNEFPGNFAAAKQSIFKIKNMRILFVLLLIPLASSGQENRNPWMDRENRIGISIGIGTVTFREKNTSPLVYRSRPPGLRLFYQLETNNTIITADLELKAGPMRPKRFPDRTLVFEEEDYKGNKQIKKFPVRGSFLGARVSVGGYYKIRSTQLSTFKTAAGIRFSNQMAYPQGWTTTGVFNALSIAPAAIVQHEINEDHRLASGLSVPVLTRLTRIPYHGSISYPNTGTTGGFFRNPTWATLPGFIAPSFNLSYDYTFNESFGAGLNYQRDHVFIRGSSPLRYSAQSLSPQFYYQL
jgi:hypothetical protein